MNEFIELRKKKVKLNLNILQSKWKSSKQSNKYEWKYLSIVTSHMFDWNKNNFLRIFSKICNFLLYDVYHSAIFSPVRYLIAL